MEFINQAYSELQREKNITDTLNFTAYQKIVGNKSATEKKSPNKQSIAEQEIFQIAD